MIAAVICSSLLSVSAPPGGRVRENFYLRSGAPRNALSGAVPWARGPRTRGSLRGAGTRAGTEALPWRWGRVVRGLAYTVTDTGRALNEECDLTDVWATWAGPPATRTPPRRASHGSGGSNSGPSPGSSW